MKKLSRNTNERKRLIRNLMRSLILHGSVKTTKAKAQATRSEVERLITKAKKKTEASNRDVMARLADKDVVKQLLDKAVTQFSSRTSGYTRIIKIGNRLGDASQEVILAFVDQEVVQEVIKPEVKKETKKPVNKETKKEEKKEEKTEEKKETKRAPRVKKTK